MPICKLSPLNQEIEIPSEESLLKGLKNKGIELNSSCGGVGTCTDCLVKVISGEKELSEITYKEKTLLGNVFFITKERLACQTKINGNVEIDISNHPQD